MIHVKKEKANINFYKIKLNEPWHEIFNNVVCATSKGSDQPAHTRSLIRTFAFRVNNSMIVKLVTD